MLLQEEVEYIHEDDLEFDNVSSDEEDMEDMRKADEEDGVAVDVLDGQRGKARVNQQEGRQIAKRHPGAHRPWAEERVSYGLSAVPLHFTQLGSIPSRQGFALTDCTVKTYFGTGKAGKPKKRIRTAEYEFEQEQIPLQHPSGW